LELKNRENKSEDGSSASEEEAVIGGAAGIAELSASLFPYRRRLTTTSSVESGNDPNISLLVTPISENVVSSKMIREESAETGRVGGIVYLRLFLFHIQ